MAKPLVNADLLGFSKKSGIPFSQLVELFVLLFKQGSLVNKEVIQSTGVSLQSLTLIKKELSPMFEKIVPQTMLSEYGKKVAQSLATLSDNRQSVKIENVESTELYNTIKDIREKSQVHDKREFDQFAATSETITKRALYMSKNFDLSGKRVLFLGDDDYTSVAVSILNEAEQVSVFEIDDLVINSIKTHAAGFNLPIKIIKGDVKDNFPTDLKSQFDVVFTDPPYTEEGIKIFLSRAIQALDFHNKASRIYFCYGNSELSREKFLKIQKVVTDSGLMIRYSLDRFNVYKGAESIGSSSNLYVCDVTPSTEPLVKGQYKGKSIYTHQN